MTWEFQLLGDGNSDVVIFNGNRLAGSIINTADSWRVEILWTPRDLVFFASTQAKAIEAARVVCNALHDVPQDLYDIAKRITLEAGFDWTDPRTGQTFKAARA